MEEAVKKAALEILGRIAPEADLHSLDPGRSFRDQFEFDSVDFLNFVLGLQEKFQLTIPERDYPRLATLNGCLEYLTDQRLSEK